MVSIKAKSDSSLLGTVRSFDPIPPFSPPALLSRAGVPKTARPVPVALHRVGARLHAHHRQDAGIRCRNNLGPSVVRARTSTHLDPGPLQRFLAPCQCCHSTVGAYSGTMPALVCLTTQIAADLLVACILSTLSPCYQPIAERGHWNKSATDSLPRTVGMQAARQPTCSAPPVCVSSAAFSRICLCHKHNPPCTYQYTRENTCSFREDVAFIQCVLFVHRAPGVGGGGVGCCCCCCIDALMKHHQEM